MQIISHEELMIVDFPAEGTTTDLLHHFVSGLSTLVLDLVCVLVGFKLTE